MADFQLIRLKATAGVLKSQKNRSLLIRKPWSLQSLDFTVNRFFMKLFKTSNIEIVHYCQNMSGSQTPSVLLSSRYQKFLSDVSCDVYS